MAASARSGSAGFGLVEVALAIVVSAVGVLAAAAVVAAIASQARRATWDTLYPIASRSVIAAIVRDGYDRAASGASAGEVAGRQFDASRLVTTPAPRLKQVRVTITLPPAPAVVFEIMLAWDRPLPAAP